MISAHPQNTMNSIFYPSMPSVRVAFVAVVDFTEGPRWSSRLYLVEAAFRPNLRTNGFITWAGVTLTLTHSSLTPPEPRRLR